MPPIPTKTKHRLLGESDAGGTHETNGAVVEGNPSENEGAAGDTPASWSRRWIYVVTDEGVVLKRRAGCYGYLAVHTSIVNPKLWAVSSLTTGLLACTLNTEEDARCMAEYLQGRWGEVFALGTRDLILQHIPRWVYRWVSRCRQTRQYLDPQVWEEEDESEDKELEP